MKIISFNIRCCDEENGHSIDERTPRLLRILNNRNADVIGLQEATPKWMGILKENLSEKYAIFNKYRDHNSPESAPILWKKDKFNCLDKGYFWFSKTPWVESMGNDAKYKCKRICQWVLLEDKKTLKQFYYMNLHFGFGDSYQIESVNLIKLTTDAFKNDNVVITGDFNMRPDTLGYKEMVKYFTDFNSVTANYKGETFHFYGKGATEHIDYCFYKEGCFKPLKYTVLNETFEGKYPSDHYGLLFEFEN